MEVDDARNRRGFTTALAILVVLGLASSAFSERTSSPRELSQPVKKACVTRYLKIPGTDPPLFSRSRLGRGFVLVPIQTIIVAAISPGGLLFFSGIVPMACPNESCCGGYICPSCSKPNIGCLSHWPRCREYPCEI